MKKYRILDASFPSPTSYEIPLTIADVADIMRATE